METTPAYLNLVVQNTEAFCNLCIERKLQWLGNTQDCLLVCAASKLLGLHKPAVERMFQ